MKGQIHNHPNANSNGFAKNPENINRKGRGTSIRKRLKEMVGNESGVFFPKEKIIEINEDGVIIDLPSDEALAARLIQIATGKSKDSLQALKLLMEQVDGKPQQTRTIKYEFNLDNFDPSLLNESQRKQFLELMKMGTGQIPNKENL